MPVVLGIDASLVKPGFAVLDPAGAMVDWRRPDHTRQDTESRAKSIFGIVRDLLDAHRPQIVAVETSAGVRFRGDGWRAGDALAFSRGVIWAAVATSTVKTRVIELQPAQVRRCLLGRRRGSPSKDEIIRYLQLVGYVIPTTKRGALLDDVADALALALYVRAAYLEGLA